MSYVCDPLVSHGFKIGYLQLCFKVCGTCTRLATLARGFAWMVFVLFTYRYTYSVFSFLLNTSRKRKRFLCNTHMTHSDDYWMFVIVKDYSSVWFARAAAGADG